MFLLLLPVITTFLVNIFYKHYFQLEYLYTGSSYNWHWVSAWVLQVNNFSEQLWSCLVICYTNVKWQTEIEKSFYIQVVSFVRQHPGSWSVTTFTSRHTSSNLLIIYMLKVYWICLLFKSKIEIQYHEGTDKVLIFTSILSNYISLLIMCTVILKCIIVSYYDNQYYCIKGKFNQMF